MASPEPIPARPEPAPPAGPVRVPPQRAKSREPLRRVVTRRLRQGFVLLLLAATVGAIALAFVPKPVPVDIAAAERTALTVTVDEDGRTRVKDRYLVSAPLLANVGRIELHPGDAVEPGTVLARLVPLDPPLLDARTRAQAEARVAAAMASRKQAASAVERARTARDFGQRDAERQRSLLKSGAGSAQFVERAELQERTSREELASSEFGARVADYDLQMAQAALGRLVKPRARGDEQLEVKSPVRGRVLRVIQGSEGVVQPGAPLLEIGDPAALEIAVDVLTSDAVHIPEAAPVLIDEWGGDHTLKGHVRLVEPSAFTRVSALGVEEQRVNVIVDLDEPHASWARLGDGYRVESHIVIWQGSSVLSVPASAVFRRDRSWSAFKLEEGRARAVLIAIGQRNAERVEILRGLNAGDRVVIHPSERVVDGVRVEKR